ncbi:MAG: carboxypeptidase-like regulatory domain-containing protein [Bacteroidia bacterium]|jgi:hypothetical protein|nr:carboxypeptidase-like regulatory domain-containing protein [Bacteroidia bacterium]
MQTTIKKNHSFILLTIALLYFTACDCVVSAKGVVIDKTTGQPLDSVALGRYVKEDPKKPSTKFEYTNNKGQFEYFGITGGLLGCPSLTLYFSKEGYKTKEINYKCSNCSTVDTVYLER